MNDQATEKKKFTLDPKKEEEICEALSEKNVDQTVGMIHDFLTEKKIHPLTGLMAMQIMIEAGKNQGIMIMKEDELSPEMKAQLERQRKEQVWN